MDSEPELVKLGYSSLKRTVGLHKWIIENNIDELASIMEFVDHSDDGSPRHYSPGQLLYNRHRELQLRRKKTEVLQDLPPKQTTNIKIVLVSF